MKAALKSGILALVVILAIAIPADAGPLEDGLAAIERDDYETALQLLEPLADQGLAVAQYNLGVMYRDGQGVPRDFAAAYMWFTLAAAQGDEEAQKNRDSLVKRMTHGQIEEARLMAREWRAEHQR